MSSNNKINSFVEFVKERYVDLDKIIEVGIGRELRYYNRVKEEIDADVFSTDIIGEEEDIVDDVFNPNVSIYRGSDLIYSIRPPMEIQKPIAEICKLVDSDLLIVPFKDEVKDLSSYFKDFKLKNHSGLSIYLGER